MKQFINDHPIIAFMSLKLVCTTTVLIIREFTGLFKGHDDDTAVIVTACENVDIPEETAGKEEATEETTEKES